MRVTIENPSDVREAFTVLRDHLACTEWVPAHGALNLSIGGFEHVDVRGGSPLIVHNVDRIGFVVLDWGRERLVDLVQFVKRVREEAAKMKDRS